MCKIILMNYPDASIGVSNKDVFVYVPFTPAQAPGNSFRLNYQKNLRIGTYKNPYFQPL